MTVSSGMLFKQRLSGHWRRLAGEQGEQEVFAEITATLSPRGAQTAGSEGPKMATVETPRSAAKWVIPESFPR